MSLPAQVPSDVVEPDPEEPRRPVLTLRDEVEAPPKRALNLIAVIGVTTAVVVMCVLGAAMSGLLSMAANAAAGFVGPADEPTAAATSPSVPGTHVDDGTWLVSVDVAPGDYQTTVPEDSGGCSWERALSADGTVNSVIQAGTGDPGDTLVILIDTTDKVFRSSGCGNWVRTPA